MSNKYYSPSGNPEVWDKKPEGYFTEEEWQEAHPAPEPPEPTKEEKLQALDSQYDSDKAEIMNYYTQALFAGDEDEVEALKEEMAEIDAEYVKARREIEAEEDSVEEE